MSALKRQHGHVRPIVMIGALLGSAIMLTIAASYVAPLGNGQRSQSLAQTANNWFSNGQTDSINPAQHVDPPTATPALLTGEGYCGGSDIWGTCATAVTDSGVMGTGQMQRPIKVQSFHSISPTRNTSSGVAAGSHIQVSTLPPHMVLL